MIKFKFINKLVAKRKCKKDLGEWSKYYCTNDCNTCGYNSYGKNNKE